MKNILAALTVVAMTSSAFAWTCATAYQGVGFSGDVLTIYDGARIAALSDYPLYSGYRGETWNNRISSLVVENGCRFVGYQYDNFGRDYRSGDRIGSRQVFYGPGSYSHVGRSNDLISSLTCTCR